MFIDVAACVAAYFGRYGWWRLWICTMIADMAIGGLGMYVVISLSVGNVDVAREDAVRKWEAGSKVSAMLVLIMAIAHIISALGGAVGCFLVWKRSRARA
ncbi:hypothetical protein QBC39DRAFT_351293 [Podospora conica]|nr:hypothetical protein QBC39DRAFT_351293 [Schizothecium conicum]